MDWGKVRTNSGVKRSGQVQRDDCSRQLAGVEVILGAPDACAQSTSGVGLYRRSNKRGGIPYTVIDATGEALDSISPYRKRDDFMIQPSSRKLALFTVWCVQAGLDNLTWRVMLRIRPVKAVLRRG